MAEADNPLDVAVRRLMRVNEVSASKLSTESPEEWDRKKLQQLDLANTSGDTLVTVKFPPGEFFDCDGFQWKTKVFLMRSDQLLATGSAVFKHLLSPGPQGQARRRLAPDCKLPDSVRFVLDLTPQMEGDDSAFLVTQLSLSQSVRDWWRFPATQDDLAHLVLGHDDNCPKHFDAPSAGKLLDPPHVDPPAIETTDSPACPDLRAIIDYCPIRHRVAILRLLVAITDNQLVLNSAPRVVTITAVAKALDCTRIVSDSVMTWLLAEPNLDFAGVNPEDALKVAWTLELAPIARAAFHVLVTEEAMDILGSGMGMSKPKGVLAGRTLFGRARATVTEEQETCIQHAAQKLAQKVEDLWKKFNSPGVYQFLGVKEWPSDYPDFCDGLRRCMHNAVASAAKCFDSFPCSAIDDNMARYVPEAERLATTHGMYRSLSPQQMMLTPYFWYQLPVSVGNIHHFLRPINAGKLGGEQRYRVLDPDVPFVIEFRTHEFITQLADAIASLEKAWTQAEAEIPPVVRSGPMVFGLSDELYKFLPLWAGGLDDGTGGVYQPEIPDAESGAAPIGPGPNFRTGETVDGDYLSSVGDTATLMTGTGTVTMTEGYSVQPALSKATKADPAGASARGRAGQHEGNATDTGDSPAAVGYASSAADYSAFGELSDYDDWDDDDDEDQEFDSPDDHSSFA